MKVRALLLLFVLFLFVKAAPAQSYSYSSRLHRWELTPFAGWETSGSYPITNSTIADRLRANAMVSFGTFIDYSLSPNFQAEFLWAHNPTSYSERSLQTGQYTKAFNTQIDQYQFGGLLHFRSSEYKLRPYVSASIGFTHDANSGGSSNRTALGFGIGGGVKYDVTNHFGFRGDTRYLPTYGNSGTGVVCDAFGNCFQTTVRNYLKRANFSIGIILRP